MQSATAQVDQERAKQFFAKAKELCKRDSGRLWGMSICAPMVIADLQTRTFATSEPAPAQARPQIVGIVNAPVDWGGVTWIAYTWNDLDGAPDWRRNEILLHEMFHGVQPKLGLGVGLLENEHLDEPEGRYWMQLEWRALARALSSSGDERKVAISDALSFRKQRRLNYPPAAENERALEINEGTASYTGTVLAASSKEEAITNALKILTPPEKDQSFVRTFAYVSGPVYGLLLDDAIPGWPRKLCASDDLGILLMNALAIQPSPNPSIAALKYEAVELLVAEQQLQQKKEAHIKELKRRFVEGPVLVFPGGGRAASNSRGATVIPGHGTVYFHSYQTSGAWGTFVGENGVLLASDGESRRAPAPVLQADGTVAGDGWNFTPSSEWTVREGKRKGDLEVVRKE